MSNLNLLQFIKIIILKKNEYNKIIGKELVSLNKNLPLTESSSIFFRVDENI